MVYKVEYIDDLFWIVKNGDVLWSIGGFIDPITPKIIIEEMEDEI